MSKGRAANTHGRTGQQAGSRLNASPGRAGWGMVKSMSAPDLSGNLAGLDWSRDWTLGRSLSFTGIGVHTGAPATLMIHPSDEPGLRLRCGEEIWPIGPGAVRDTRFCTTIGPVMTLEHVLAALHGMGISAAEIEIEDPEAPVLDGSAAPFVRALRSVGTLALASRRKVMKLKAPWQWEKGDVRILAEPAERLSIHYEIGFTRGDRTVLDQAYDFVWSPDNFAREIAPARTFSFEADVAGMRAAGLALGGSLENAYVLDERGSGLTPARFEDEPVRHKILDCIGDLALLGSWLNAALRIRRGGHSAHVTMVKSLKGQGLLADEHES